MARWLCRNIPAHTGNSLRHWRTSDNTAEHPRPYGEFVLPSLACLASHGTSPPIRGIPFDPPRCLEPCRNIPAHTGNSGHYPALSKKQTEHPRPYGEFSADSRSYQRLRGTSPPIRGIRAGFDRSGGAVRNIPAHTGNSSVPAPPRQKRTEHPRPYGEFSVP